jgi:hypothetical protein
MRRNQIKCAISGEIAVLVIPRGFERFRCYVDAKDLPEIRSSCSTLSVNLALGNVPYVMTRVRGERIPLHRFLLGLSAEDARVGDHVNGNTLDCRRKNLRPVTSSVNSYNRKGATATCLSGIRGVQKSGKRWRANLKPDSSNGSYVGTFGTQREAALAVLKRLLKIDPVSAKRYADSLPGEFLYHPAAVPREAS